MYLKSSGGGVMIFKNTVLSLLDMFRLNKGQKIVEKSIVLPTPLIQRLQLPPIPSDLRSISDRREFVIGVIRANYPGKISRRVLKEITCYYGMDLRGYREYRGPIFRGIPERSKILKVLQS